MYSQGQKVCYEVSATRILIKAETLDITDIENALQNPVAGSLKNIYDLGGRLFLIEMKNTTKEDMWNIQRQFSSREDVIFTSPVFVDDRGFEASSYTNEVIVGLKYKDDYTVLQKSAEDYSIKDIKPLGFDVTELTYILTLPHNSEKDVMQTALELHETGLFVYAEPNILTLCPLESCPFELEVSMNTVTEERIAVIYPNPVRDILYVDPGKFVYTASCDIRLYNSLGNMCRQVKTTGETVEFSVSNLPGGIYFLIICDGSSSKPETHKIIVKY
ncbi:MAG: T9SS type A sorting domain-containing protein [Prevotellaceae bacterium]|nr:T9SS type A sorting domain-containing protein [Prevotellaceae bacterium]